MLKKCALMLILLLTMCGGLCAGTKEEIMRLQSDMLSMQNRILELQKTSDANAKAIRSLLEQLNEQLGKTNSTLNAIREGMSAQQADSKLTMDNVLRETRTLGEKLEDTNTRISTLAQQVSAAKIQVEETAKDRGQPGGANSATGVFNTAMNDFNRGNYELALQGFQNYLSNYKGTELAGDAQYYIGESLYNLNRFEEAILSFNQVINGYPKSSRLMAAHLKKGLALLELNRRADAIEQFRLLIRRYPDSPEANIARQKLELLGARSERGAQRDKPTSRKR